MKKLTLAMAIAAISTVGLIGCNDDTDETQSSSTTMSTGDTLVLTESGQLASFNREQPNILVSQAAITGLQDNDSIVGIDYRPIDGQLYAVGHLGNIYTIDPASSKAVFKSKLTADANDTSMPFTMITAEKNQMSVDFNPVADRLRVMGADGQNLRINVDTGATITDGMINGADATITATAYTNSFAGTGSTRMFDIDVKGSMLYQQNPPNDGVLSIAAPLGVTATGSSGFDIDAINNQGIAILNVGAKQQLFAINLQSVGSTNNAATLIGDIPSSLGNILGIALKPNDNAGAMVQGLSSNNQLVSFWANNPSSVMVKPVTGLAENEKLLGIDYRLRTTEPNKSGLLYGLTNLANLYTIDPDTGAASNKTMLTAATDDSTAPFTMLNGTDFAVDFNPLADRLRVISNTGQNLRINVDTGATITDGDLNGVTMASVRAGAYTNSFQGTISSTALFDLDQSSNTLLQQVPPNDGTLVAIGDLGIMLGEHRGFDIAGGDNGLVLAINRTAMSDVSALYRVNLTNGTATPAISSGNPTAPSVEASTIGSNSTPQLIDIAIMLK